MPLSFNNLFEFLAGEGGNLFEGGIFEGGRLFEALLYLRKII